MGWIHDPLESITNSYKLIGKGLASSFSLNFEIFDLFASVEEH